MNLKVKAGLDIAGFILFAVFVSGLVQFVLSTVDTQTILMGLGAGFVGYMVYLLYSIRLGQLEYRAKLKEMVDNK